MTVSTEQIDCPLCGQYSNIHELGRTGLIPEEMVIVRQYVKEGVLGKILRVAEIIYQRLDPTTTSMELSFTQSLDELTNRLSEKMEQNSRMLTGISEKIAGPAIGNVSERIIAEELKQAFPKDDFDTSQAEKHGTDIISTIVDKKVDVGKISISIKDTNSWSSSYLTQLEKNLKQDGTKIGMLVSKKLPKNANASGEVMNSNGDMYVLVHPRYALASYTALRQVVIMMQNTKQFIANKEQEMIQLGNISKKLAKWLSGEQYRELTTLLEEIKGDTETSINTLLKLQEHVARKIKTTCDTQTNIKQKILNAENWVSQLKEMLKGTKEKMDDGK